MNTIPISANYEDSLASITELMRRSIDGTTVPLVVDTVNQRVLVGESAVVNTNAKLEVNGIISIVGAANGVVLTAASGNRYLVSISEVTGDDGTTYGQLVVSRTT